MMEEKRDFWPFRSADVKMETDDGNSNHDGVLRWIRICITQVQPVCCAVGLYKSDDLDPGIYTFSSCRRILGHIV